MQIDYPFHLDHRGRTATTDEDDHIHDLIEQVLFTNRGERVNRPDFGCGLLQLIFAANSPELANALQATVQAALQRWLDDLIETQEAEVTSDDSTIRVAVRHIVLRKRDQQVSNPPVAQFVRTV